MIKWEAKIITAFEAEELNTLMAEGWEPVSLAYINGATPKVLLKRPLDSEDDWLQT